MTRNWTVRIATAGLLAAALAIGFTRTRREEDPPAAIYAMLDAARAGDVKAYMARFGGPMETSLRQMLSESSPAAFAAYLRDTNAAIKGVVVSDPQLSGSSATVQIQYVYADRTESQTMYLEKSGPVWKIVQTGAGERIKTPIPYGTPVR